MKRKRDCTTGLYLRSTTSSIVRMATYMKCRAKTFLLPVLSAALICHCDFSRASTLDVGYAGSYATIQDAYDAAGYGDTIRVQAGMYLEDDIFDGDLPVSVIGGYDGSFSTNGSYSELAGTLTIAKGTVTLENMIIDPAVSEIPLSDDFPGSAVDSGIWHIPTWVSPTDGTYVGQTQFRCTPAPLPQVIGGNAIVPLNTYNPTGSSFYGTDLICNQSFSLGEGIIVTVRAKLNAPIPAGIVGGIFLYAPPADSGNTLHDEIDFELLSNDPENVRTNIYGNEPLGVGHPAAHPYPAGSATDYHTYQIRWLPNQVSWYLDGTLVRTVTTDSPLPTGPMYVHINIWVPGEEYADAYDADLHWTDSQDEDQTFTMSVEYVTVFAM